MGCLTGAKLGFDETKIKQKAGLLEVMDTGRDTGRETRIK